MSLDLFDWLNITTAVVGALVFIFCIGMVFNIIKLFPNARMTRDWKVINILIGFFLVGYLLNIIAVINAWTSVLLVMQAFVYLFGAIFVFIVVRLSLRTYKIIIESANKNT